MLQINRQEELRGVPGIIMGHESFEVIIGGNSLDDSRVPPAYGLLVKTTASDISLWECASSMHVK